MKKTGLSLERAAKFAIIRPSKDSTWEKNQNSGKKLKFFRNWTKINTDWELEETH